MTTRVEVEVIFTLEIDVPCEQRDNDGLMARLATGVVKRAFLPTMRHPQTGEAVAPEVWCFGVTRPGCPKVGYGVVDGDHAIGTRITKAVLG